MYQQIEVFWTVWPSSVATVHQVAQLLGAPNARAVAPYLQTTKHRVEFAGVTSRVAIRPGAPFDSYDLKQRCKEAGEVVGLVDRKAWPRPFEVMLEQWPGNIATLAQVRRFLNDYRRDELLDDLKPYGVKVLRDKVRLPGDTNRSPVVVLRGDLPLIPKREHRLDPNKRYADGEAYVKHLQRRDVMRQCAKLAAQAGEQLTGERGNYYPTNGLA